ncbi:MAG: hypothetical protein QS721_14715 [Candidatus Endonucleobacter sp. (ex Gigantidas childressi)]|nr:hypothetical protein [Candidatus Endonucleobacter sp. (ex Gigantidas childressi)]
MVKLYTPEVTVSVFGGKGIRQYEEFDNRWLAWVASSTVSLSAVGIGAMGASKYVGGGDE